MGCIAPRKIVLTDIRDPMLEPASTELINKELEFPRSVYSSVQARGNLRILKKMDDLASMVHWGFE